MKVRPKDAKDDGGKIATSKDLEEVKNPTEKKEEVP